LKEINVTKYTAPVYFGMLYLAYDGSMNGDWIARYAIQLATQIDDRTLQVIHIFDRESIDAISEKIDDLHELAAEHNVHLMTRKVPRISDEKISDLLEKTIPHSRDSIVIAGARAKDKKQGFLKGTVSEKLLYSDLFNVLVLRVVQSGRAGFHGGLVLPVSGRDKSVYQNNRFLSMLLPLADSLHLLHIVRAGKSFVSHRARTGLQHRGLSYVREIQEELDSYKKDVHSSSLLSANWKHDLLAYANRWKAGLILLGATERKFGGSADMEYLLSYSPVDVAVFRIIE